MKALSLWHGDVLVHYPATTMLAIAERTAARSGLTLAELRSRSRSPKITHPRQDAMVAMHQTGQFSNAQIARFFGLKDHSTVVDGRQSSERRAMKQARAA